MSAPLTPKPDASKSRPGASRFALFAVPLFYMFFGAVLGMIALRAVSGNVWHGGHGAVAAVGVIYLAAMFLGQALGAIAWFHLTTGPRFQLSFLLASLVAGMAAGDSLALLLYVDTVSFVRGSQPVEPALHDVIIGGLLGLFPGAIIGVCGVISIRVSNAGRRRLSNEFVTIGDFQFVSQAEVCKLLLQDHGFNVVLADAELVNTNWSLVNAVGYIAVGYFRLQVPSNQAEAATACLQQFREKQRDNRSANAEAETCLSCGAEMNPDETNCHACGWSYGATEENNS